MEAWQLILFGLLVLLPVALLFDFHPSRERLTSRGRPIERTWKRGKHPDPDAAHAERHHH